MSTLLDRMAAVQKQVNTEPLLQQNQKLQQDVTDTKKLIQSTKVQLGKPAPKAALEAMFATTMEDVAKRIRKLLSPTARRLCGIHDFSSEYINRAGKEWLGLCEGVSGLYFCERARTLHEARRGTRL